MSIDKILKVEDLSSLSTDLLIAAYKNGYKVEELPPHNNPNIAANKAENGIKSVDIYEEWKPLTDEQLHKIRSSLNKSENRTLNNQLKYPLLSLTFGIDNPSSCPLTLSQGTQHQITIKASGGTPPYTFEMFNENYIPWKDSNGNSWKYITNSESSISWHNTFNNSPGSHKIIARVTDSQPNPQVTESSYTITIDECLTSSLRSSTS